MDDNSIYLGVWTNYSNGTVMGATLTTTRQYGNLLISFTGFLISFVASRLWYIFCVILHQYFSTSNSRDTIHHQRQVILRNSTSPDSGLISLFQLLLAWRKTARPKDTRRYSRLLPIILLAICCSCAFTVAAGFSSQISTVAGDVVLLKGDHCGFILPPHTPPNSTTSLAAYAYHSTLLNNAANYAQQCYSTNTSGILSCNKFVVQKLPMMSPDKDAGCPFQGDICRSNTSNLRLDTGLIDSNDDLGINTPENHRFAWRYVLQCAPLMTQGYTSQHTAANHTWVKYHYGGFEYDTDTDLSEKYTNFTYQTNAVSYQYVPVLESSDAGNNYLLSSSTSITSDNGTQIEMSDFTPIPQLFRPDADLTIIFLVGNGVLNIQPLDDEWYRATVFGGNITTNYRPFLSAVPGYIPAEAASPLGCTQQWQWCNSAYPGETRCGPLASKSDAASGAASLFNLTRAELDTDNISTITQASLSWPVWMQHVGSADLSGILTGLGAKSLESQSLLFSGIQYPLPQNQWQLDVTNWWNIILASNQAAYINAAVGNTDPDLSNITFFPNDQEVEFCNNQKVRSTAYSSFNLFGLLFTYITSVLIIIVSFLLHPILKFLHSRYNHKHYAYLEWTTNATLQLHRLAQEELHMGTWSSTCESVPITKGGDMLASLDIIDLKHPVLKLRPASTPVEDVKPEHPVLPCPPASTPIEAVKLEQTSQYSGNSTYSATRMGNRIESAAKNTSNQDNSSGETIAGNCVSHDNCLPSSMISTHSVDGIDHLTTPTSFPDV